MPQTRRVKLHDDWVIWPENKDKDAVLLLKENTRDDVWAAGYQGDPIAEGGTIFNRTWWSAIEARYDATVKTLTNTTLRRYITFDTANKDREENDFTGYTVADLLPDYRVLIRRVWQEKLEGADLPDLIEGIANRFNHDEKLSEVIIEDKQSGTISIQTLKNQSELWLRPKIRAYKDNRSKTERARSVTRYCKFGRVLLPLASTEADWLSTFTEQLYAFPGARHDDMVDSFTSVLFWLENYIVDGMLNAGIAPEDD